MAYIIGLVQVKGGAGRSTIATNLAGLFATRYRTALIDCDMPQGTSTNWFAIWQEARLRAALKKPTGAGDWFARWQAVGKASNLALATAETHLELVKAIDSLHRTQDVLVIDAPPRLAEITRAALLLSHLSLIPVAPSAAELWATADLLPMIQEAQATKPAVDARIVWNRFRAVTKSAQELTENCQRALNLKALDARLGYRVAFSDALARGRTVLEWPDAAARQELVALGQEVGRILRVRRQENPA